MKNIKHRITLLILLILAAYCPARPNYAQKEYETDDTIIEESTLGLNMREENLVVKTKDGLHFMLPEDWPVEKKDGIVVPMTIYEYVHLKLKKLDGRLKEMEGRISGIEQVAGDTARKTEAKSLTSTIAGSTYDERINYLELELRDAKTAAEDRSAPLANEKRIGVLEGRIKELESAPQPVKKAGVEKPVEGFVEIVD
ncbi:MAG: hypothetical protein ABIJ27_03700 [Candidatus Omnitrophota bacterium]